MLERYPDVPVYATPVTVELTRVLHADARRIMQMRLEEEGELPLYDEVATTRLLEAFRPVKINQPLTLAPGLTATFFLAGHIAGAAMIGLAADEGRILISGDISIDPQRTVDGARPPAFSPAAQSECHPGRGASPASTAGLARFQRTEHLCGSR